MKPAIKLIIAIATPLAVGAVSGFFTSQSVDGWYTTIAKPSFNPPSWVFGPAWTTLYILMGIAFYLIWKSEKADAGKKTAIRLYFMQLALNFLWSLLFFGAREIGWALVDIILLWVLILLTILSFRKISPLAAWLLVPYICWVSFATVLNYAIWKLN